jgi:hypothetical protein
VEYWLVAQQGIGYIELSQAEEPVSMHETATVVWAAYAETYWEKNWT